MAKLIHARLYISIPIFFSTKLQKSGNSDALLDRKAGPVFVIVELVNDIHRLSIVIGYS